MNGFLEFRRIVKTNVTRTVPSPAGLWYRHMEHGIPEADQFVVSLCYGFLQGTGIEEVVSGVLADDDLLWYMQEFVAREACAIQRPQDNEPLVVGLAAVSVIARASDPRDITGWIGTLFQAAQAAGLKDIPVYFERVASRLQASCPLAAEKMRSYPALIQQFNARNLNKEKRS